MRLILCNCPVDAAATIARDLVHARLAACVNIVPGVRSIYRWDGKLEDAIEHTLWVKTASDRVDALVEHLRTIHPYDTPEILVLDVDATASDPRYLAWVHAQTREEGPA